MHELGIALGIVGVISQELQSHPGRSLLRVGIRSGGGAGVEPVCLRTCLDVAFEAEGWAGVGIEIKAVAVEARCNGCGEAFQPQPDDYRCGHCRSANVTVVAGQWVEVAWMELA